MLAPCSQAFQVRIQMHFVHNKFHFPKLLASEFSIELLNESLNLPVINRPNFVICVFDSLSMVDFDLLARNSTLTALSQLCQSGVSFTRCYTPNPQSSPARASLFTGLDPAVHGLWTNGVELPASEQTFIERLANAGYCTYLAGRVQLAGVSRWTTEHISKTYTRSHWAHGPLHRSRQNAWLQWLQQEAPEHHVRIFQTQADPDKTIIESQQRTALAALPDELSFNYWVGQQLCTSIANNPKDKPFVAVAGFSVGDGLGAEPHPDGDGEELNEQALKQADAALAQLHQQLLADKLADDTIVIAISARGNANPEDAESQMKERSLRVPLIINHSKAGQGCIDTPVSVMDLAPTVLALANVDTSPRIQGCSLLEVLRGTVASKGWILSRLRHRSSSGADNWQTAYCTESMKLVVKHKHKSKITTALYAIDTDPDELNNLAILPEYAAELETMIDQMIDARCALEDRTEPRIAEF